VLCTEHVEAVLVVHKELAEELRKKQARKAEDVILKDWSRLIRSTIHRFKLLREARRGNPAAVAVDDVHFIDDASLFAETGVHEHEFVTHRNEETNVHSQVCACGFSKTFQEF